MHLQIDNSRKLKSYRLIEVVLGRSERPLCFLDVREAHGQEQGQVLIFIHPVPFCPQSVSVTPPPSQVMQKNLQNRKYLLF